MAFSFTSPQTWMHLSWEAATAHGFDPTTLKARLKAACQAEDVYLDSVGVAADHVHVLLKLPAGKRLSRLAKQLKRATRPVAGDWLRGFRATPVRQECLGPTRRHVMRQEGYHTRKTFAEECCEWQLQPVPEL